MYSKHAPLPYQFRELPDHRLQVTTPTPRLPFLTPAVVWLVAWAVGLYYALASIIIPDSGWTSSNFLIGVILFWLALWLVPGLFILLAVAWAYLGRETLTVGSSRVILKRRVVRLGPTRAANAAGRFSFREISTGVFTATSKLSIFGLGGGKIKYTEGGNSFSFGLGLTDEEARELTQRLNEAVGTLD